MPQPPPTCTLDPGFPSGTSVVSCGFPPHVTVIGVDAAAVYAETEAGAFYRVDKLTGDKTLLYRHPPASPGGQTVFASGAGDDAVLAGGLLLTFTLQVGVWTLDPNKPSKPVEVLGDVFENRPLADASSLYYLRAEMAPGSIQYVDVERMPLGGGASVVIDPTYDTPVALAGGFVYLASGDGARRLLRVPTSGGPVTPVLDTLDCSGGPGSIAADVDAVYVIGSSPVTGLDATYPITRFPVAGEPPIVLTRVGPIDPEVPGPTPWGLRLDGAFVYYLGSSTIGAPFGSSATLYRVPNAAPSPEPKTVVTATSLGPPSFDAAFVYIALQRGGTNDPVEGAILRIPKSALQ